ncbi:E3 ubiquitin-protein ligase TRIM33-like [Saccostrea cucullata]|uniref:E3 ubiquitin-protein ligase TRIM33-like n=1 Tax=Saccostrea cuccullata TaxID=36930 RepID=UPI002ED46269
MAEALDVAKGTEVVNLTICSICYEVYKSPKSLPLCLHTFCKNCISSYASSVLKSSNSDNKSELLCPICRRKYIIVDDLTKWINGLPHNHVIDQLIGLMEKSENECDSCKRREKESVATNRCLDCCDNLCDDCTCYHKGHRYSMDHTVLKIEELKSQKQAGFHMFCKKHENRKLEVYCFDHEGPYCLMCATMEHRTCKQVESLEECSKLYTEEKLTSFRQRLDMLYRRSKGHLEHLHVQKNDFHSNVSLILDRIRTDKEKTFQFLNEKEAAICSEYVPLKKLRNSYTKTEKTKHKFIVHLRKA